MSDHSIISTEEVPKVEIKLKRRGRYPKPEEEKAKIKENSKQYNREYYHKTKEDITCSCGMVMNKRCMNRHLKRRVHEENLKIINCAKSN